MPDIYYVVKSYTKLMSLIAQLRDIGVSVILDEKNPNFIQINNHGYSEDDPNSFIFTYEDTDEFIAFATGLILGYKLAQAKLDNSGAFKWEIILWNPLILNIDGFCVIIVFNYFFLWSY